jgi:protein involved in polysaccharide export with SLBB domain
VPTAPPLPYTFVGSYAEGNKDTVYFLTRDDRVYDVKPGDTLDQIYSVDAVENGQLIFTYKPLNIRQTLSVGGGP